MRAGRPVNLLQMQVSPSVVLRGTRLWNKPGDLRSPCLSQNATRMERLPRSVSLPPQMSSPLFFTLHLSLGGDNMSVSSQVQRRLFLSFYLSRENVCQKWRTAVALVSSPVWMCIHEQLNVTLNSTGAVSAIKTVVADGILNQWPAGVEPTSLSDLSATSIFVPGEQVWLIRAAGTQAQFPLTF